MNAVLIIDKPAGLTSHDVVNRARRILRERSIGHLGTLDPMATGVLPLVTGSLTRLAQFYTASEKIYEGTIRFGFATDTYDAEGEPTTAPQEVHLRPEQIETLAARFRGVIQQTPPPFSAKKIRGVPAYKLARQQKEVKLQPVQVEIKEFEILAVDRVRVHFRARVASGTYMRSVAHDMGRELACGAHLESLRRTAVAEFTLADAHTLEELANLCHPDQTCPPDPDDRHRDNHQHCHPDRSLSFPKGETSEAEGPAVAPGAPFLASFARSGDLAANEREPAPSLPNAADFDADADADADADGRESGPRPSNRTPRTDGPSPGEPAPIPPKGTPETEAPSPEGTPENSPPVLLAGKRRSGAEPRPGGTPETLEALFIHPRKLLPQFPSVTADDATAARIRSGRTVNLPDLSRAPLVKVFAGQRDLIAIATRIAGTLFHPKIVLCS